MHSLAPMRKLLIVITLLSLCYCSVSGQHPSYYFLGEQELANQEIYDIYHDSRGFYWLATDDGVLCYDGYQFQNITCPGVLTHSMFKILEDSQQRIYFHNLSGQVFRIDTNGACTLHYTVPDSLLTALLRLGIDHQDRLVIYARSAFIFVNANGEDSILPSGDNVPQLASGLVYDSASNSLVSLDIVSKKMVFIRNGLINQKEVGPRLRSIMDDFISLIVAGNEIYACSRKYAKIIHVETDSIVLEYEIRPGVQNRFVGTQSFAWIASYITGVRSLTADFCTESSASLFEGTFVACIEQDRHGNILIGTLRDGILVIPNMATANVFAFKEKERPVSMALLDNGQLMFGTQLGNLYQSDVSGELQQLDFHGGMIELLEEENQGRIFMNDGTALLYDPVTGQSERMNISTLKAVEQMGPDSCLLATSAGAFFFDLKTSQLKKITELALRHYAIGYDSTARQVYAGTSRGLALWKKGEEPLFYTLNGEDIATKEIVAYQGRVYVATTGQGLLAFSRGKLIHTWDEASGILSDRVFHVKPYEGNLFISTSGAIQVLDTSGRVLLIINRSDGLNAEHIIDFEINDSILWAMTGSGVQKVSLESLKPFTYKPKLNICSIHVNDSISPFQPQLSLGTEENKLAFELCVRNLRYQSEIRYLYKLDGVDSEWQQLPYEENLVQFKSLSAGDYTFRAKVVCRNNESAVKIVRFSIASPFWLSWWFYCITSLLTVMSIALFYRYQLRAQKKRAHLINELNASKLVAIQSQMNPHFIFNALNSIQDLVLKGDIQHSYTYISRFADLLRHTLLASDLEFVELEKELKLIELYLEMEKLRFKESFEFRIETNGMNDLMVPPMLVQPFIENALTHGLLHKTGLKKLSVEFRMTETENLQCIITDNGIGRQAAEEINRRRKTNHESFSVKAIRKRLLILKELFSDQKIQVIYSDLSENSVASGTKVCLTLPYKRLW